MPKGRESIDVDTRQELIWEAKADPFGRIWPDTFVYLLNTDPQQAAATVQPIGEQIAEQVGEKDNIHFPPIEEARKQQQALRRVVDRYLETKDWTRAAEYVNQQLAKRPYQFYLQTYQETLLLPPRKRRKGAVSLFPTKRPHTFYWDDWEGFARLLTSDKLERLKKCPECGKYFLATKPKQQKYCSRDCSQRVADRNYRKRHPEEFREKKREAMKESRQRKQQQATK